MLNRPYALMKWVQEVKIPEKYVLMSEPDHVWLKPMPNLMVRQQGWRAQRWGASGSCCLICPRPRGGPLGVLRPRHTRQPPAPHR